MADSTLLVLGIDGGATHTAAVLADARTGATLGRGEAGPSNIQAVGVAPAGSVRTARTSPRCQDRQVTVAGSRSGSW